MLDATHSKTVGEMLHIERSSIEDDAGSLFFEDQSAFGTDENITKSLAISEADMSAVMKRNRRHVLCSAEVHDVCLRR